MQWWCAALGEQWTWTWRAYPGVWLFVIAVGAGFRWLAGSGAWSRATATERGALIVGGLTLWASLDWPLGPIAAGYLASAHALQFLIETMVAAPLLLFGVRSGFAARAPRTMPPLARRAGRLVVHPLMAAIVFNVVVATTHVPAVVDGLMPSALGAFAIDAAWFFSAVLFWWPVIMPAPSYPHFGPPLKILYLLVGTLFHTVIGMIMLSAELPIYGVYELAPPIFAISPRADQQLAGGIMELGVFGAIVISSAIVFFRWANKDERRA
ncbi:MAG: cytochrome c oxidase assembly protein [Gemmatimonadetes bacterium]|nr:cytochrome c oxidase assembly protein [Gemmatimonadota bacterium]